MKSKILIIALAGILLGGCSGIRQYVPLIDASLASGKAIAEAGKVLAINGKNAPGCYTAAAFSTAIDSTMQVIDSWEAGTIVPDAKGDVVIPSVDIDISACHDLMPGGVSPVFDEQSKIQVKMIANAVTPALVSVTKSIVLNADDISCEDKVLAGAILDYFNGVVPVVIGEMGAPDGKMTVPAVTMRLSKCN